MGKLRLQVCGFMKSESVEVADGMLDAFKELNPNWAKVKCIITDKDFADIDATKVSKCIYPDMFISCVANI